MKFITLIACLVASICATLANLTIMRTVSGDGGGLVVYQIITVIFVGLIIGLMFSVESSDFNKTPKQKTIVSKKGEGKSAWEK